MCKNKSHGASGSKREHSFAFTILNWAQATGNPSKARISSAASRPPASTPLAVRSGPARPAPARGLPAGLRRGLPAAGSAGGPPLPILRWLPVRRIGELGDGGAAAAPVPSTGLDSASASSAVGRGLLSAAEYSVCTAQINNSCGIFSIEMQLGGGSHLHVPGGGDLLPQLLDLLVREGLAVRELGPLPLGLLYPLVHLPQEHSSS